MDVTALSTLIIALGGGTGVATLIVKLAAFMKERRAGHLEREDTAITRWQAIADEREEQVAELTAVLNWYRAAYSKLWAAYAVGPPPRTDDYPSSYEDRPQ